MLPSSSWSLWLGCLMGVGTLPIATARPEIVPGRAFERFISIWLENQDFSKVIANADFADLKRYGISQTRYYAHTHPSQPNYIASVAGDYFGLNHDGVVDIPANVSTVVDLLESRNISYGMYYEGMPGPGYMAAGSVGKEVTKMGSWDYVRKHNHLVSFESVHNKGTRLMWLESFSDFKRYLGEGKVPQFVMMSPNMNNDGHNTSLEYATKWAHGFLLPLLKEGVFQERTLIQLTYDESEDYGKPNQIVSLLLGSAVPKSEEGTDDHDFYTHYSILATVENNWGLHNLGRYDVGANVFRLVAHATKYMNKDPANLATVNNSVSYPGFLNSQSPASGMPPPNQQLVGAGGKPILESIAKTWKAQANDKTPYDGSGKVFDGGKNLPVYDVPKKNTA